MRAKWGRRQSIDALYPYNKVNLVITCLSPGQTPLPNSSAVQLLDVSSPWWHFEDHGETHNKHLDVGEEDEVTLLATKTSGMQYECWEAN